MAETELKSPAVGSRIKRVEDRKLITGQGSYVDDIQLPRMAHAAFLRSPHAHAYIKGINTRKAVELPGVIAVRTGQDLNDKIPPLRVGGGRAGVKPIYTTPLADGKVRMVGDPVAVVVATDRYIAEDALDLIEVEYEPLPAEVDAEKGAAGNAGFIHEHLDNNIASYDEGHTGDIDEAYRQADRVIKETFQASRCSHVPMECRGLIAHWVPSTGDLTIWASLQFAHMGRTLFADVLKLSEGRVRVVVPDVGGSFGQKSHVYPEDLSVCLMSIELGVPVKWTEDRRENLTASCQARDDLVEIEAAVKNNGKILGIRARVIADVGAHGLYPWPLNTWSLLLISTLCGPYNIPHYKWEVTCVMTNKVPIGPMRGPGSAVGTWAREGLVDIIARELELDPVQVRLTNMSLDGDQSPHSPTEHTETKDSSVETLEKAVQLADYALVRSEQRNARAANRYLGIGIGTFSSHSGAAAPSEEANQPSDQIKPDEPTVQDPPGEVGIYSQIHAVQEVATVRMLPNGRVQAFVAVSPHGQSHETTLSQVLADELGVPMGTIEVLHGDSDMPADGAGTWGDRSTVYGGGAIILAGRDLRQKVLKVASLLMETPLDDLDISDGYVFQRSAPEERLAVASIARTALTDPGRFPEELQGGLLSSRGYADPQQVGSTGAHIAIVEVDAETGQVNVKRYVAVEDCGRVINPMIVEGQIRGSIAQGLGEVLLEQMVTDESGQPLTATFLDYMLPEATDMSDIEVHLIDNPSPHTLGGFKSAGNGSISAAVPAISNAIADALAPFGARTNRLPLKPDRILQITGQIPEAS